MFDFLKLLFDTEDFPARWHCGNWTSLHGWIHILSDLAIAGAYAMIPIAIARYCWVKRSELAFPKVLWLFAAFIFSCGSAHLVEAIIFYHPIYRVAALLKVVTAVVSWATVCAIIRIAPKALELPGVLRMNHQLEEQLQISVRAREAVERSNHELEAFAGVVSHDLKNPISGALFMAELAKETNDAGDPLLVSTQLDIVLASLRQMESFVEELHAEALSRRTSTRKWISLNQVLVAVLEKLAPVMESTHARVKSGILPMVSGNPTLLQQLFSNLIENAIKYRSVEDPVIIIDAEQEGTDQIVRVTDNGRGIPREEYERVFQPRVRARNVGGVNGSGLGLSLCRRIMDEHGGSIMIIETDLGTTFELRFPITKSE